MATVGRMGTGLITMIIPARTFTVNFGDRVFMVTDTGAQDSIMILAAEGSRAEGLRGDLMGVFTEEEEDSVMAAVVAMAAAATAGDGRTTEIYEFEDF